MILFLARARGFLFSGVSVLGSEPTDSPVNMGIGG